MSIKDYALELGVSSDIILKKLKELGHNYNNENEGKKWDEIRNYDVVINSSTMGVNGAGELLAGIIGEENLS